MAAVNDEGHAIEALRRLGYPVGDTDGDGSDEEADDVTEAERDLKSDNETHTEFSEEMDAECAADNGEGCPNGKGGMESNAGSERESRS